jgi:Zn-dependent peptidase ImmA (M78 family)/DNA-binding XRE family transcriptional regulator
MIYNYLRGDETEKHRIMATYIGEKLRKLREERDMSLSHLGGMSGVSRQSMHRYEQNAKTPSSSTILEISKALNVHPSYFFSSVNDNVQITNIRFRDEDMITHMRSKLLEIESTCKSYISNLIELQFLLDDVIKFENPLKGLKISNAKDVERAAKKLRSKWNLGNAPIYNTTEMIEGNGVLVIEVTTEEKFTGLTGTANEEIPFIVINSNCNESTRKRFTLLHELGHVVLEFTEQLKDEVIEKLCNHFAGAILLVDDTLQHELGKNRTTISLKELREIKEKYGVSIQSIIIRAKATGYISEKTSNNWWDSYQQWYKESADSSEFGNYKSDERAKLFDSLILRGLNEKRITWGKAARLKDTKVDILKSRLNELEFNVA